MINRLKKAIGSCWARSKVFRIMVVAAFFLFLAVPIFLLTVYARILFGITFWVLLVIVRLIFVYVARKEGYVEKAKELSPRYYYYARRVDVTVGGGLFTGFAILTALRVLLGPLPYPHSFLLFLVLIAVGALIGDMVGRKLRLY